MIVELLQGIRRTSAVLNLTLIGVANAQPLMAISAGAAMIGTKSLVLKRIKIRNNACGNGFVHFGTGAAGTWVEGIPPLWSVNNTTDDYMEYDLPQWEAFLTITTFPDLVGAGSFDVQVEVEERG